MSFPLTTLGRHRVIVLSSDYSIFPSVISESLSLCVLFQDPSSMNAPFAHKGESNRKIHHEEKKNVFWCFLHSKQTCMRICSIDVDNVAVFVCTRFRNS